MGHKLIFVPALERAPLHAARWVTTNAATSAGASKSMIAHDGNIEPQAFDQDMTSESFPERG